MYFYVVYVEENYTYILRFNNLYTSGVKMYTLSSLLVLLMPKFSYVFVPVSGVVEGAEEG